MFKGFSAFCQTWTFIEITKVRERGNDQFDIMFGVVDSEGCHYWRTFQSKRKHFFYRTVYMLQHKNNVDIQNNVTLEEEKKERKKKRKRKKGKKRNKGFKNV